MSELLAEWRDNWRIVICAMAGVICSVAHLFSIGVLVPYISAEMAWSRAQTSSGLLISAIVAAIVSPVAGRLIDRGHIRACAIGGIALYSMAFIALGWPQGGLPAWLLVWGVLAVGASISNLTIWTTAITRRFVAARGLTLAIVLCGSGVATAIFPMLASTLAAHFGWRHAFLVLGAGIAAVCLPLFIPWVHELPAEHPNSAKGGGKRPPPANCWTGSFFKLAALSLVLTTALTGTTIHFPLIAASNGATAARAGYLAGLIGLGAIAGRLVIGTLLDRFSGAIVGAVAMLFPLAAMVLLLQASSGATGAGVAAALLLGLGMGSEVMLLAFITGRLYKAEVFGSVWGILVALMSIASGVGPVAAGKVFDRSGNYSTFLVGGIGIVCVAIIAFLSFRKALRDVEGYPQPSRRVRGD